MEDYIVKVAVVGDPHPMEWWYWVSQITLTAIAFGTAIFTGIQLWMIRSHRKQEVRLANATFLLELDRRWDSPEMGQTRDLLLKLRDDISKLVSSKFPLASDAERSERIRDEFAVILRQMREQDRVQYLVLLRICGFFETAGLMVKKGFISEDVILSLFKGPVLSIDTCFRAHIEERQKEMGVPKGFFEHALDLCDRAKSCG